MPRTRNPYPAEFREQIVALAQAGRSVESLAREFEPCVATIHGWIKQAECDGGIRDDGLTKERYERELSPHPDAIVTEVPSLTVKDSASAEAGWLAAEILEHKSAGTPLEDQAILVRFMTKGRRIEAELLARHIPYQVVRRHCSLSGRSYQGSVVHPAPLSKTAPTMSPCSASCSAIRASAQ